MGLADDALRARMVAEAEAAIDRLLAKRKPAETITLREIEQLVLAAREEVGEQWAQELVGDSAGRQLVPGPACRGCGQEMRYKGKKGKRLVTEVGEGGTGLLSLPDTQGRAFSPWMPGGQGMKAGTATA